MRVGVEEAKSGAAPRVNLPRPVQLSLESLVPKMTFSKLPDLPCSFDSCNEFEADEKEANEEEEEEAEEEEDSWLRSWRRWARLFWADQVAEGRTEAMERRQLWTSVSAQCKLETCHATRGQAGSC